jgi:hypothetical protein
LGVTPCAVKEKKPTYLENRCLAHGGEIPSTPLLETNFPYSYFPNSLTPPTPLAVLYDNDDIKNFGFLIRNTKKYSWTKGTSIAMVMSTT